MRYNLLLKFLRILVQIKRFFWWIGARIYFVLSQIIIPFWQLFGYLYYKIGYLFKKLGFTTFGTVIRRDNLQVLIFTILFIVAIPQTKLYAKKTNYLPGQKTLAYNLTTSEEEYNIEEITTSDQSYNNVPTWREGALVGDPNVGISSDANWREQDIAGIMAGGSTLSKPVIMPGVNIGGKREKVETYIVLPGDSISSIAYQFGLNIATILWENNLSARSLIKPGDKLRILPVNGVTHLVKKGDTLNKIASLYGAKSEDIVNFNRLNEKGTDLKIGESITVPGGTIKTVTSPKPNVSQVAGKVTVPPPSKQTAGTSGFVWPSGAKTITQYYGWTHHAIDVAGPLNTPNYAAKAGTVEIAQCGWNSGYGCYIVINHGGGVKTLYGHHNKLLVSPGDYVEAGQTIGLMGNTGKVRGVTGIHLHFEIRINGVLVNPLGYVR